ncbi:peptidase M48 [Massilia eurypsychrophila]|jgi:Zn-dependent protease with chaperone function|uniref:Peptidase M48 n=1 Tax=Massilia eurypsychrophila TaxID=1485217 RepID=A0A2G8THI7_9BURK|nr:M48 family metallopeptidase [Massilia eurypsychrophila]PIL45495.1 peptidase M48 [Massilia eurypsychrophila]
MIKLKRFAAIAALCALAACDRAKEAPPADAGPAAAEQTQVQDGIAVKPLSRWRHLEPEKAVDQQASQQYAGLIEQARQAGALIPDEHPQVGRLRGIAKRIIPYTERWNPQAAEWKWQVNLLNSEQVNAFCMPGGRIAFFTGILTQLKLTDDEAAAVMGHEIAHALREHGRERAAKATATGVASRIIGFGLSAWLGVDPRLTDTVASSAGQLVVLKFSRDEEREADLIGLDLAARAGFDPRAGIALWRKMGALNKRAPVQILSTHPGGEERIVEMERHMDVLLPLYARAKGVSVDQLPPYRTAALPN